MTNGELKDKLKIIGNSLEILTSDITSYIDIALSDYNDESINESHIQETIIDLNNKFNLFNNKLTLAKKIYKTNTTSIITLGYLKRIHKLVEDERTIFGNLVLLHASGDTNE